MTDKSLTMNRVYMEAALNFLINREPDKAVFMFEQCVIAEVKRLSASKRKYE